MSTVIHACYTPVNCPRPAFKGLVILLWDDRQHDRQHGGEEQTET